MVKEGEMDKIESDNEKLFETNFQKYDNVYKEKRAFLRYPADWIIRFHNMYMKKSLPEGRILDYGCGSGNNLAFFYNNGYEVVGTDITESVLPLIHENVGTIENIRILPPDVEILPFEDSSFDMILSNQVLYYLCSESNIVKICNEFKRMLKPGGVVFFTMMGPSNYYIKDYSHKVDEHLYEIKIEGNHRLSGYHEYIFVVEDESHLKALFSMFDCLTTGYFDQKMFDLDSNFHWIFVGKKS
jgi:SAM-dependent methyltransferase